MDLPYIEEQTVWGHTFQFSIHTQRSEDWYGLRRWVRDAGGDDALARRRLDEWNPQLREIIHPGDVVLDVGCNEGWTTCLFARQVGPAGKVIAIDASAYCVERTRRNVELNSLQNVTMMQRVVGELSGEEIGFHEAAELVSAFSPRVPSLALDDLLELNPTAIKVDVEGWEVPVLRGARRLLERGVRLEVDLHLSEDPRGVNMTRMFGYDPREIVDLLRQHGYSIHRGGAAFDPAGPITGGCMWCTKEDR